MSGLAALETIIASAGVKFKLQTRTYEQKYEIIKFSEANPEMKQKASTAKFDIRPSNCFFILNNFEELDFIRLTHKTDFFTSWMKFHGPFKSE